MPKSSQDFLPEDYEEPTTSRYMKFEEGENRFRILPAKEEKPTLIMGWEYWRTVEGNRKPVRVPRNVTISLTDLEEDPKTGEIEQPKFFWAFAVWNYAAKTVQILEIKQKTIRAAMESLSKNPKWGSPIQYDLTVIQTVENKKTSYSVTPDPKEEIDPAILEEYGRTPLDLEALYRGDDPFSIGDREQLVGEEEKVEKNLPL